MIKKQYQLIPNSVIDKKPTKSRNDFRPRLLQNEPCAKPSYLLSMGL